MCLWTCSWHFLPAHFHVVASWYFWKIETHISTFEHFCKILEYEFWRSYSYFSETCLVPFPRCNHVGFLIWHGREMFRSFEYCQVCFAKHPYANRALLQTRPDSLGTVVCKICRSEPICTPILQLTRHGQLLYPPPPFIIRSWACRVNNPRTLRKTFRKIMRQPQSCRNVHTMERQERRTRVDEMWEVTNICSAHNIGNTQKSNPICRQQDMVYI